jgi:threonine aldolase
VPGYRIDLRSDIHTVPAAAMYRAMADAGVGGDAPADEDAAVPALEAQCAETFGGELGEGTTDGNHR